VLEVLSRARVSEDMGRVSGPVVGEELLGSDAQPSVVGEGSPQKSDAGDSALIGQDFGVQDP